MRRRSGAICVTSIDELVSEVKAMQMQRRDSEEQVNEITYRLHEMEMDEFELELGNPSPNSQTTYKTIVLGASGVGKSSLVRRLVNDLFSEVYEPSSGYTLCRMNVTAFEAKELVHHAKMEIWDTPSSSSLTPLVKSYYNSMQGALVVYDPTHPLTLDIAMKFIEDLPTHTARLLVANKSDLRLKSVDQGVLSASAKSGENVLEVFLQLQGLIRCF